MNVCVEPAPPHDPGADDPAAEAAFYRDGLMRFSQIALDLAEEVVSPGPNAESVDERPPPTLAAKAEIVDRLARIFRRNARLARFLREPLRTTPHSPAPGRGPRPDAAPRDLSKMSNAELEALARLEGLEPLEPLDRFPGPFAFHGTADPAPLYVPAQAPEPVSAPQPGLAIGTAPGPSRHPNPRPATPVHPAHNPAHHPDTS